MIIIKNKLIPFRGFATINLFGILFTKCDNLSDCSINHEYIHTMQMKEMLYIFFYIWYIIEYVILLIKYRNTNEAYFNISFEKEAYDNQFDANYKYNRRHYIWINYIKNKHK